MAVENRRDDFMPLNSKIYFLVVQKRQTKTTDDACKRMNDFILGRKRQREAYMRKKYWKVG